MEPIYKLEKEEAKDNYTRFVITPLEKGYGMTLGNALRRVLYSSLPGAAITQVRISGVRHQFSTLKGMKEDVLDLLLNLKKVRLNYSGDEPVKLSLSAKGEGEVLAGDIETPSNVTIANPDLVLATLDKDSKLEVEMEAVSGIGYSPAEERETNKVGAIPLDAAFSPVVRVNYNVEETRVGRVTNYDKLTLELWTDGTMSGEDALIRASKTLVKYFSHITSPQEVEEKEEEKKEETFGPMGHLSVEEVGLPTRVANALIKSGYETVEELAKASNDDLMKVRNLGDKSIDIIDEALKVKGVDRANA